MSKAGCGGSVCVWLQGEVVAVPAAGNPREQKASTAGGAVRFGDVLRRAREDCNLTQEQLAEMSGLHVRTIQNLESGRTRTAHPGNLERLCAALRLAPAQRAAFLDAARSGRRGETLITGQDRKLQDRELETTASGPDNGSNDAANGGTWPPGSTDRIGRYWTVAAVAAVAVLASALGVAWWLLGGDSTDGRAGATDVSVEPQHPGETCQRPRVEQSEAADVLGATPLQVDGRVLEATLMRNQDDDTLSVYAQLHGALRASDQIWLDITFVYDGDPRADRLHEKCGYLFASGGGDRTVTESFVLQPQVGLAARACAAAFNRTGMNYFSCTAWHAFPDR
jgi:transcriptional regulator with XRE-family HTH domain